MGKLKEKTREEITSFLVDCMYGEMFGDGLEKEYIRCGFNFEGVDSWSDGEIVENMLNYTEEEDELYQKAQAQLKEAEAKEVIHKLLKKY